MKAETRILEHASNLEGDRIGMSIDESALAHIMSVLTDLYSDPELAVIREYSTNALDAHVDAGQARPIEVTLPSPLAPFFTVRDYGTGLSATDIRDVFSRYGTSTKRDSNDVVGMLGLGCKSALTYADQFTLTSTKRGRTVQVLVSRDEDGAGSMTIVQDATTGDADGTTVTVPAKRDNAFEVKARDFFRFWTEGTVLVNGAPPTRIDGLWLDENLLLTRDCDRDYVVMGNVAYPTGEQAYRPGGGAHRFVAFVDIGEVSFTPSRESLQMTKGTKATLERLAAEVEAKRDASVLSQVAAAASPSEAVRLYAEGRAVGFKGDAKYKGRNVPLRLDRTPRNGTTGKPLATSAADGDGHTTFLAGGYRYSRVKGERSFVFDLLTDGTEWLLFEGFDGREMTPTKRDKLALWLENRGEDASSARPFVLVSRFTPSERFWLDGRTIHNFADVDALKLPTSAVLADGKGRLRGSYDALVFGSRVEIAAADIDATRPVYWLHASRWDLENHDVVRNGGVLDTRGATLVALPANRVEKFRRDFPSAVNLNDAARAQGTAWLATVTPADKAAYAFQREHGAGLGKLDASRVDDPALRKAIALAARDTKAVRDGFARWSRLGVRVPDIPLSGDAPLREYPLLSGGYGNSIHDHPHVYMYVNAAYAARKDGES